jgi:Holliday junction resolvase-like predicted endonuclease
MRGLTSELIVGQYFKNLGYEILHERLRTKFAEIDLVVKNHEEVILVEVKSNSSAEWVRVRVSQRQKKKLRLALRYMQTQFSLPVSLHLATVTKDGEIQIYADFLS